MISQLNKFKVTRKKLHIYTDNMYRKDCVTAKGYSGAYTQGLTHGLLHVPLRMVP